METEARSYSADVSKTLINRCKEYKADIQNLRDQLNKSAKELPAMASSRSDLVQLCFLYIIIIYYIGNQRC